MPTTPRMLSQYSPKSTPERKPQEFSLDTPEKVSRHKGSDVDLFIPGGPQKQKETVLFFPEDTWPTEMGQRIEHQGYVMLETFGEQICFRNFDGRAIFLTMAEVGCTGQTSLAPMHIRDQHGKDVRQASFRELWLPCKSDLVLGHPES